MCQHSTLSGFPSVAQEDRTGGCCNNTEAKRSDIQTAVSQRHDGSVGQTFYNVTAIKRENQGFSLPLQLNRKSESNPPHESGECKQTNKNIQELYYFSKGIVIVDQF